MILRALKEYYDRKAADPDSSVAMFGWNYKPIPFVFVIDENGSLIQIEDTRDPGKGKNGRIFLVPRAENRSSNIVANLLWDKAEYLFPGIDVKNKPATRLEEQRTAFKSRIEAELGDLDCIKSLIRFLTNVTTERLSKEYCWSDIKKNNPYISFRLQNELNLICRREDVINRIDGITKNDPSVNDNPANHICLISGQSSPIKRIHGKTFINRKNNSLVSFQKNSGYDSYGKEQGYNAPISESSEFAYVTGLNILLKSGRQRFSMGDGVYVCWSAKETSFENQVLMFFDDPNTRDDPDQFSENVKALFDSINSGAFIQEEGSQVFYVLGLSPGGGTRISVRFWDSNTINAYATNIKRYFDELSIVKPESYPEYFSIWRLLVNIAQQGDSDKIPPNLAGDIVRAIICGLPYPETLLQAALRRIRSGIKRRSKNGNVSIERTTPEIAALLKAYLNRYYRFHPKHDYKEVNKQLDINQPSTGYQLGRLFAVLEKIQEEANPGINTSIRERFYGSACSTPVIVFNNLLKLKNHHLSKLDKNSKVVYFERLLGEIIDKITEFPSYLTLHEQGLFAIGYYHQRQSFYKTKTKPE